MNGGEGGIRTHVPLTGQDAFEAPPLRPLRYLSAASRSRPDLRLYQRPAPLPEERLHQLAARVLEHAADGGETMVQTRKLAAPDRRDERTGLGLCRAVH